MDKWELKDTKSAIYLESVNNHLLRSQRHMLPLHQPRNPKLIRRQNPQQKHSQEKKLIRKS